jgi:hypothetical protein
MVLGKDGKTYELVSSNETNTCLLCVFGIKDVGCICPKIIPVVEYPCSYTTYWREIKEKI